MGGKRLEVHTTRGGECKFSYNGTPIDIVAMWAALTDHIVQITGKPLCELVKVTDAYDEEKWPTQAKRSRWRPWGNIVYDQYQCERCGKIIQTDGVSLPIECPVCRSVMDTGRRKEKSK